MKRLLMPAALAVALAAPLRAATASNATPAPAPAPAPASGYALDPASSRLEFSGVQAGAEFKGTFRKFTADVVFSPEALAGSRFDVLIDLGSEDTGDKDRDDTIRGPDIFDVAHSPTAHYVARSFAKIATGYTAVGALTLRGVTKDVTIAFHWSPAPTGATLAGTAELKRLDFGVGRGDWKSTEWVADAVKIAFSLNLKAKP